MTSHEERARVWLNKELNLVGTLPGDIKSLAAEFAAVEAEAQKRVAQVESALKRAHELSCIEGTTTYEIARLLTDELHRIGEPTALLALLERAADDSRLYPLDDINDIAKRVLESRSDDIVHREGR